MAVFCRHPVVFKYLQIGQFLLTQSQEASVEANIYMKPDFTILGRWISIIRSDLEYSQESVAAMASVDVRTIQRLEAGNSVNKNTLRSVAGALGYQNHDIFYTEAFWRGMGEFNSLIGELAEKAEREEIDKIRREVDPNMHLVDVTIAKSGREIGQLAEGAMSFYPIADEGCSPEAFSEAAHLFDYFVEYGDAKDCYSFSAREEVYDDLESIREELEEADHVCLIGLQKVISLEENKEGCNSVSEMAILIVVPREKAALRVTIPKTMKAHF